MKKVISWILVAVMLLGALPVLASAQTAGFVGYNISLGESIAVEFYAEATSLADFDKLIFYKNDTQVAEITSCPGAESDGMVYFKCDKLGPHEMDASIKAELYLTTSDTPVDTKSVSVLDYCTTALTWNDEKLTKLIVDMLNYGAAAQAYTNNGTDISAYIATLDESVTALGATGTASASKLSTTVSKEVENPTASFTEATLVLNAGIVPSFTFTTEADVSGLTAVITCAGKTWNVNNFKAAADANTYTFDFYGLNPSQVRSWIYVSLQDAQGNAVSDTCVFTAEHYTASAAESEQALTNAMMHYGDAVKAYVTRDISESVLTEDEKAVLSALTPEQYKAAIADTAVKASGIVNWAYAEAGIDVSDSFDLTVFNLMKKIFEGSAGARTLIPSNSTSYVAKYGKMLVDGYYGGSEVSDVDKLFAAEDLQVGDVFCAISYKTPTDYTSTKSYYAGVYLGDGKFLMSGNTIDSSSASINTELVFKTTLADDMGIYFVLRPEQLALQETGGLSAEKQAELAALTVADLTAAKKTNDTGVIKWFCQKVGMTPDNVKNFSSIVTISTNLFNKNSDTPWTIKDDETVYHQLFVDGYYGGVKFGATNSKTFTAADFAIGDIFCAQDTSENRYVGLYQGNGQFLMYMYDKTNGTNYVDTTMAFGDLATTCNYYFVLRPAQYLNSAS